MTVTARRVGFLAVLAVLAGVTGCKSDNEGKIVGKWRVNEGMSGMKMPPPGASVVLIYEFTADNRLEVSATISMMGQQVEKKVVTTARYKLGAGDTVNLTDISPPIEGKSSSREKVTIKDNGNTMVISSGTFMGKPLILTRYTEK